MTTAQIAGRMAAAGSGEGSLVPDRPNLFALLLGLAGRVPDDGLAEMRMCLADGEEGELAWLLSVAVETGRLALTATEAALVQMLFEECGIDPGPIGQAPRIGELPTLPYRFSGQSGAEAPAGDGPPSSTPSLLPPSARDAADAAVIEAGDRVGGVIGIWRVFRRSRTAAEQRVYLAEAEPGADVVELGAEMQHALTETSGDVPRVEVFPAEAPLAPYHEVALAAAALVWSVSEAPVRMARAFDGADLDDGPFFYADHPRREGADSERVLAYLRAGELVLNTPGAMDDVLDPGRVAAVPVGFRSDGRWVWPDAVAYYLKVHGLAPEPELIAHILAMSSPPALLSRLARHRALATLFAPSGVEPVWQAG